MFRRPHFSLFFGGGFWGLNWSLWSPKICDVILFCRRIEIGHTVSSVYGDGVVVEAVKEGFGYRIFHVQLFDSGQIVKVNRLEVEKIDTLEEFDEDMVCEDGFEDVVVEVESEDLPTIEAPKKKRFVVVESEAEIDDLADGRMARLTQAQTRWAVKIFRGG